MLILTSSDSLSNSIPVLSCDADNWDSDHSFPTKHSEIDWCGAFSTKLERGVTVFFACKHFCLQTLSSEKPVFIVSSCTKRAANMTAMLVKSLAYIIYLKGPILYCLSSILHSCQRSNNTVCVCMYCPKHIRGPEFQLSKSRSAELYSEQSVSVPAPLNTNELRLSTPTWGALPAMSLSGRGSPLC